MKKYIFFSLLGIIIALIFIPFLFSSGSSPITAETEKEPVLLVHGYFGSLIDPNVYWLYIRNSLTNDGFKVYTVALPNAATSDVRIAAETVKNKVEDILKETGASKVDIVGHSEGTLANWYYIRYLGGVYKVDDYVGLAGPIRGTTETGWLPAPGEAANQMLPGSEFLRDLHNRARGAIDIIPPPVDYTSIYSTNDECVIPQSNALIDGALNEVTTGLGHLGILNDATVYSWLKASLMVDFPATVQSILINNGAVSTKSTQATLNLQGINTLKPDFTPSQMMISVNANFSGANWESYNTSKSATLSSGDGLKIYYVKFKDASGNISPSFSDDILLDTGNPSGSLFINNGTSYTKTTDVNLQLNSDDNIDKQETYDEGGIGATGICDADVRKVMISNNSSFVGANWEDYNNTTWDIHTLDKNWSITPGDGVKTAYVKYQDYAGNISSSYSDTIILDTQSPDGSILINGGASSTNDPQVNLALAAADSGSGVSQMCLSNRSDFQDTKWESFNSSKAWILDGGNGKNNVYVKFQDGVGNISAVYSDDINLNTTKPTGWISIQNCASYINSQTVSLTLYAADDVGVAQMMLSNSASFPGVSWETYSSSKVWNLSSGGGVKNVYVKYKDGAGNESYPSSDSIILDTQKPTGSVSINGGNTSTPSTPVTLSLSANDNYGVSEMIISNNPDFSSATWELYASTKSWRILSGSGTRTVYVEYKDLSGNISNKFSDSINLLEDGVPPDGSISINSGSTYTKNSLVTLNLNLEDNNSTSQESSMMISNDSSFTGAGWESFMANKAWLLPSEEGAKSVYIKYKDAAGNTSSPYSASIIADLTAPTGSVVINGGAIFTNTNSVSLTLSAQDSGVGISDFVLSNNGSSYSTWQSYATSKLWTLSSGDGTKYVYVEFRDKSGNISSPISDTTIMDTTPPNNFELIYPENNSDIDDINPEFSWQGARDNISGVAKYQLYIDGILNKDNLTGVSAFPVAYLSKGSHTWSVKALDNVGNARLSSTFNFNITSTTALTKKSIIRLYGKTRYETAVEISKHGWSTAETAVLARGDLFPDALAGVPLAYKYDAPILLTDSTFLRDCVVEEMKRLKIKKVIILGLTSALSSDVESELVSKVGLAKENIKRIGGTDRYETAQLIARQLRQNSPSTIDSAVIATGENYPDALAIGSLAARNGMPILLCCNKATATLEAVKSFLKESKISKVIIVGGTSAIDAEIENSLKGENYQITRLSGLNRYETARAIAIRALKEGLEVKKIFSATGENFPDALSAGPLAARYKAPILLLNKETLSSSTLEWLKSNKASIFYIYICGGPDVVPDTVADEIKTTIQ